MSENTAVQELIGLGREIKLWKRGIGYLHYCREQLFHDIQFRGKALLDVGCGSGIYSAWAAVQGAKEVVSLEPSASGSGPASPVETLRTIQRRLNLDNLQIREDTLQVFQMEKDHFDMILLHYSINHLDEAQCITLHENDESRRVYRDLFAKMFSMLKEGGSIVMVDCTNRSFWSDLGIINPFAPSIEWFKHQPPEIWIEVMTEAGFREPRITWTYDNRLLRAGKLLKNRVASYFYTSIFRLEMQKQTRSLGKPQSSSLIVQE